MNIGTDNKEENFEEEETFPNSNVEKQKHYHHHHMMYAEKRLGNSYENYCEIDNVIKLFCNEHKILNKNMNSREDKLVIENFKLYNPPGDGDCFFHCIVKYLQLNDTTFTKEPVNGLNLRLFMSKYIKNVAEWCDELLMPQDVQKTLDILSNQKIIVQLIYDDFKKTHRSYTEPQLIRMLVENEILHFYPFITNLSLKEQLINISKNIADPKLYIGDEFAIFMMQTLFNNIRINVLIPEVVDNAWFFEFGNYKSQKEENSIGNEKLDILLFLFHSHYYLFVPNNTF